MAFAWDRYRLVSEGGIEDQNTRGIFKLTLEAT